MPKNLFGEAASSCQFPCKSFFIFWKMKEALQRWNLEKFEYLGFSAFVFQHWYVVILFDLHLMKMIFPHFE